MKIWLLWAWVVGVAWSQEAIPWDYSSWQPILSNCKTCREGKKVEIRPAQMEQLSFDLVPGQQQKRQVNLDQLSFKSVPLQQQQKSIFPLKSTSIPKRISLTKDQETAAQTTAVQAQRFNVHKQQIFDHQQKTTKQKQNTKLFQVPLVHSEQVLQPIQQIDFSDKVKRDQDGSLVLGGSPNSLTSNLLMTLVTSKGQEADAKAKLALLEAALTSSQPNHQQDGHLPRIFIAPSHVPAPPGYVKIALVPQADAASQPRDSLPQTFLTPNAQNLGPGLVRLDLPHSVSHLSRDIPVVVPNDQVAPNPFGFPHLNPLVSHPEASLNIQTPNEVREAKAISSSSPIVQIVSKGEPSTASPPQTTSRPASPSPTAPRFRPIPAAPQTTPRPPPPPPPPQFSRPPPQFQQQQQRFPASPSPFARRPPFTAFPGAPIQGQQFNGPPRFIPGQPQSFQGQGFPFQGQGFPQPTSQFRPGQQFPAPGQQFPAPGQQFSAPGQQFPAPGQQFPAPGQQFPAPGQQFPAPGQHFPAPGQQFPAPGQPFPAPGQPFPGAPQQFPGSPQQIPHRFNGAPVQFGQPPSNPPQFRPEQNVFRNPNPTIQPDFPQISEITPKPILFTTPRPAPTKKPSATIPNTPKPKPKPTTLRPIPVTSPRPIPTSTPRIISVTPPLRRPTPKAFEAASPNPQIFSQGSPKPQFRSTPFIVRPTAQPTPRPFPTSPFPSPAIPSSPFPSSPFPSSPFPPSPFQQTSKPRFLPPRPALPTSPFTIQPTPLPVPSSTPFAPRSPVIPGFQQPKSPRFPTFQEAQKPRIPSSVETKRPTTTVERPRPKNPTFQIPRRPFQPLFTEPGTPKIGKSAAPEVLEAERAGFQSIETSIPTLVNSEKPLIPSFQRPKIQSLKPIEVTSSPVTTTSKQTTTITTTTTTAVTTPEPTTASSTTSGSNVTTFKPRFRGVVGRRRPILRRKPIKRIKKPITNVQDAGNPVEEKKEETSTLFPPFSVANRLNRLRKKEELGISGSVEDPKTGMTIPPRGTFGRRIRPRTRTPNTISSTDSSSRSEPVNGRRLPPWLEQRRRARLRITSTQKTPVDEAIKDDTPVDILGSNEFTGAESALVVVSQPAENSAFDYRDAAKTLQEKEKVLRNEQISVAVKAAEDALLHYADVVEDEITIEKDLSAIETLTHSKSVSEIDDDYEIYEPEPEPEVAAAPEPEPEPTFDNAVYNENTEEVTVAYPSAHEIEEESAYPEPKPNTEYVDQYFDYEDTLEDTFTTTLPFIDDLKHIPSSKPHLPYSTLVEISLDSHRSDIPIETSLEPEYAPVEHDDIFVAPSDSLEDQDILLEADTATDTPLDNVTEQPLLFDTQPQIIIQDPAYDDYYDYDDYVDSFGDDSDQSFGGSVSQVIYAVPASDWRPDAAINSEKSLVGSGITLSVTDNSVGVSTVPSVASESTPGSPDISQGVTYQESPKFVDPPADELPVTTELYLGDDSGTGVFNTESPEDLLLFDESFFDDMITTIVPETETSWPSFSVKPITITPPTSTPSSKPPKENKLNKANLEEMKWSVRGPKVLSHSVITESRTSNARVCFSDGTCFDASGIRRKRSNLN